MTVVTICRRHDRIGRFRIGDHRIGGHGHVTMVMVMAIVWIHAAGAGLMAVGDRPLRGQRRQQGRPADHGDLLNSETEGFLEPVLHDLVMVELDVRRHEIGLGDAHEQHALSGRLD